MREPRSGTEEFIIKTLTIVQMKVLDLAHGRHGGEIPLAIFSPWMELSNPAF